MIVPEKVLEAIFDQLPLVNIDGTDYKVRFSWGSQIDCNLHLASIQTTNKYPLIWLVQSKETHSQGDIEIKKPIKLIIAKNSQHATSLNPTVWDTEFANVLNPLLVNVIKGLNLSGISFVSGTAENKYEIERLANFSESWKNDKGETFTIDNWNVIVLECNMMFTGNVECIQQINFNY